MNDELLEACERHRRIAREHPVTEAILRLMVKEPWATRGYCFRYGKFDITIMLNAVFKKPMWQASIAIYETIGEVGVPLEMGDRMMVITEPQEALLALNSWSKDDFKIAREILRECLAPEIVRPTQIVQEMKGLMALSISTNAETENITRLN